MSMIKALKIFCALFFVMIVSSQQPINEYIILHMNYNEGKFSIVGKSLEKGFYPDYSHTTSSQYTLQLTSEDGILYQNSFDPTLLYSEGADDNSDIEGGPVILDNADFALIIPSLPEGENVLIFDANGEKVFEEDIYNVGATSCRIR